MENKKLLLLLMLLCFFLSSCSTEESENNTPVPEKATLVLGAVLNKTISEFTLKQQLNGYCDSLVPAFANVVISQESELVAGTMDEPMRMKISGNPSSTGGYFMDDSSTLILNPGSCVLEHFSILNDAGDIIWIAPIQSDNNSAIANLVSNPLPMVIDLQSGEQQYVNVEVVCFDDRILNSYGYVFSEIETTQAIEFCIFGSLCDENGRHQEFIQYQVSAWKYSGDEENPKGENLYTNLENEVFVTDYEDHAETSSVPLCFSLPDSQGEDLYFLEIALKDSVETIRSGIISDAQVKELFADEEKLEYFHFRKGNCNMEDTPHLFHE